MLASATDHLCRTQSYHFPGIVADISLENLCSPTADEKYYNAFTNRHLGLSSEFPGKTFVNDINQNISNEKTLKSLVTTPKEANANCDLTHKKDAIGHSDHAEGMLESEKVWQDDFKTKTVSTTQNNGASSSLVTSNIQSITHNTGKRDEKCDKSDDVEIGESILDLESTDDQSDPVHNGINGKIASLGTSEKTGKANDGICDSPINDKPDEQNDLSKERVFTSRNPFVNIRTLGDGSDGAYEISIQNLYPANIQLTAHDDADTDDNADSQQVNKDRTSHNEKSSRASPSFKDSTDPIHQSGDLSEEKNGDCKQRKSERATADNKQEISLSDEPTGHLNKDLMLKLQKLLKTCAKNLHTENDTKQIVSTSKRDYILMRSCTDESGTTPKLHESTVVKENGICSTPPIETYDVHRRRKRRPRKLPEIPKQNQKDLNLSLPLKFNSQVQDPPKGSILSLADELRIATLANNDVSQSEENEFSSSHQCKPDYLSESSKPMTPPSPPSNLGLNQEPVLSRIQNQMNTSGVNSILSLKELGSPEDIEPPSFRDSGFFQDVEYDEEIVKQQLQIEQQQQMLLRTLYKDRHGKVYVNDCDSGYNTQDPECQSRPTSVGPNLCCKCGSEVVHIKDDSVPQKLANSNVDSSLVSSAQSITDCYIDDIPKANEPPKKEVMLEYSGQLYREPPDGGNSDKSSSEEEDKDVDVKPLTIQGKKDKAPSNNDLTGISEMELMYLDVTHRCCHKFVPRHDDELFIEIGDPIYVCKEEDDLWCEGVNLRTKKKGIFPSVCATDLNFLEGEGDGQCRPVRFYLRFLGSVQVKYPKGSQVLTQAIQKVVMSRRITLNSNPPPMSCLEVNDYGIKLSEKTTRKVSSSSRMPRSLSQILGRGSTSATENDDNSHFYSLKNVTYCGYHATNQKYFGFITKHPLEMKFACHVMLGEESTRCISEAVSAVFKKYYQKYLAESHPTEDIYLED